MSYKNTEIEGDLAVGRHIVAGGNMNIRGNAKIGHNLKVEGYLEAPNIKDINKGVFVSYQDLLTHYPTAKDGWLAGVVETITDADTQETNTQLTAYIGIGGQWVKQGFALAVNMDVEQLKRQESNLYINVTDLLKLDEAKTLAEILELIDGEMPSTVAALYMVPGVVLTFLGAEGWETWRWAGETYEDWSDETLWEDVDSKHLEAKVNEEVLRLDNNTGYYECDTAAATAAKEITGGSYKLPDAAPYGGSIKVKFTYKNSAANPTLSINGSPAKPLYYNGSIASSTNTWEDGDVLDLYYDGTNFNARSVVEKFATGEKVKNVGIDSEPTAGSENLVKGGGVANMYGSYTDNPDYIIAVVDKDYKLLYGIQSDGNFFFGAGCPEQIKQYIANSLSDKVDKVVGKSLIDELYAATKSTIETSEFLEMIVDKDGKIISARTPKGELVENVGLVLSDRAMAKLQEDLIAAGFNPGSSDFPKGGHDGEVLSTDGNGNYYWRTIPTTTDTDVSQTFGVLVDQYEDLNQGGISWVPAIRKAVEVAGVGGTIVFTPNKTYNINDVINLLDNQVVIGNGATLRRMNESTTTVAVAIDNSTTNQVEVASVPSDWVAGNRLFFYDEAQGLLGNYIAYADIASISGNVVTVTAKSANPWTLPIGTKVTKSVVMLAGEQAPNPWGFKVYNLKFDGNRDNNGSLLNWYIHGSIHSYGYNTVISDCHFYNIPTENIGTQGAFIRNCYAQDLNGSFVHLSCPSEAMLNGNERYMGTFVIGNMCKRVCSVDNSILKHSEAPVTYSWNAGKLIVVGNQFYGNGQSMCFQANMNIPEEPESPTETGSNSYMIYIGNIFCNFNKIGQWGGGSAYIYPNQCKRMFTSNMFKDCGTNDMRSLYTKTNIMFEMNKLEGNTVINTGGDSLMYRIDTEISSTPTPSALTLKYTNLPIGGEVYITQISKLYKKILSSSASIVWTEENLNVLS